MGISVIEVSNVNFIDTDVDSLMKSTNLSFPIFMGINLASGILKAKFSLSPVPALCVYDSCLKTFIAKKFFPLHKLIELKASE